MSTLTRDVIIDALRQVPYPGLTRDVVSFGMVQQVAVCDGRVKVQLGLHTRDEKLVGQLASSIRDALEPLGATNVAVEVVPPKPAPKAPPVARAGTPDPWADQVKLAAVRHVIAVGAGKGGVGKSTVAQTSPSLSHATACARACSTPTSTGRASRFSSGWKTVRDECACRRTSTFSRSKRSACH